MNESTNPRPASTGGLMDLLLRSGDALQNRQALLTLVATTVGSIVIMMACVSSGVGILMGLGGLLTTLLVYAGFSAAGIQLMDQAQGLEPRDVVPALMDGLFAAVKLFVLGLIAGGVVLLALLVLALVLLICKIPGLGALLLALAVPVSVLALAFLFASLYFALAMVGPAVWSGATLKESLVMLWALATRRLVGMALGVLMHTLIMGVVAVIVLGFVAWASFVVGGLGAGILNLGGGFPSVSSLLLGGGLGGFLGGGSNGSLMGMGFGFGLMAALISAGLFLMFMLGLNRLYLHLTAGLDVLDLASKMDGHLDRTREKTRVLREEARQRAEEMRKRRDTQLSVREIDGPVQAPPRTTPACPQCHAVIDAGDKFCQHCGHPLKGVVEL